MVFPNKCTTLEAAIKRYGPIDLASGHWPGQNVWIKLLEFDPKLLAAFPNWKVLDTQMPVTHIAANRDIHAPLVGALQQVAHLNLGALLHSFDGCFNIRKVRGSSSISTHAYGVGLDLNASTDQLGAASGGFYDHPDFVKCFTDQGFDWGGNFHSRKDPMHFSYGWE